MNNRGKLIVLEGGEGVGKSTLSKYLVKKLDALYIHEPGGTEVGKAIHDMMLKSKFSDSLTVPEQFLLVWAGRSANVREKILPALRSGQHVICDRFDGSTFAYQLVAGGHEDLQWLFNDFRSMFMKNCMPDLYLWLDAPVEIALERKQKVDEDEKNSFDRKSLNFHEAVRAGYEKFAKNYPKVVRRIDASQPAELVEADALRELGELFFRAEKPERGFFLA